jgi:hypothetical protein
MTCSGATSCGGTVRAPTEFFPGPRTILFATGKERAQVISDAQDEEMGSVTL